MTAVALSKIIYPMIKILPSKLITMSNDLVHLRARILVAVLGFNCWKKILEDFIKPYIKKAIFHFQ